MLDQSIPMTTEWQSVPCKEWTGTRTPDGYGRLHVGGRKFEKNLLVHRVTWEAEYGPIPDGMCICHHCDNRACYEVKHLFLGTQADNVRDMDAKGRRVTGNSLKTHCVHGHEFTTENTYIQIRGGRTHRLCRECRRDADNRRKPRR
jgi:hypothetical protein